MPLHGGDLNSLLAAVQAHRENHRAKATDPRWWMDRAVCRKSVREIHAVIRKMGWLE